MADFATVLRKTIEGLEENTAETRARVYQRARDTIEAKLAAASSPEDIAARQRQLLEDAVATVEADYQEPAASQPIDDELDSLLSSLDAPEQQDSSAAADEGPEAAFQAADDHQTPENEEPDLSDETPFPPVETEQAAADEYHEAQIEEPVSEDVEEPGFAEPEPGFDHADTPPEEEDEAETAAAAPPPPPPRHRARRGGLVLALLIGVVFVGAAAYGGWHYRDDLINLAGLDGADSAAVAQDNGDAEAQEPETEPVEVAAAGNSGATDDQEAPPPSEEKGKFTQRLTPEGEEIDEGPAGDEPTLGEGTSVAAATQLENAAPLENEGQAGDEALAVGQKAIFYEERTNSSEGSAQSGNVVWSIVEESPGNNLPPEPAVRAEATIPDKDLQLKMTIRRNVDQSLPASHIVELIFLTPENFAGGSVDNVLRVAMKRSEQDTGSPLLGIPAKIADGFFLVALSDSQADLETNTTLMRRQSWLDIPIVYTSGRRALMTLEKGTAGAEVFDEAMQAWANASSG